MTEVGRLVARAVKADHESDAGRQELAVIADQVTALVSRFPAYGR